MLVYLFYIRSKISSLRSPELSLPTLPLDDTVVLTFGGQPNKPSFLYDFFLRFATTNMDIDSYFDGNDLDDGEMHCFRNVDVPVPSRTGTWDVMYHNLKGRWGTDDFYYNFWIEGKKLILKMYGLEENETRKTVDEKLKVVWFLRYGSGTSRDDGNVNLIKSVFSKYFDFEFLQGDDFTWKEDEADRFAKTQATISKIQSSDVAVGLFGANLWNSLLMPSNRMLVELKSAYGYCANENGRTLSSHNHLRFYSSDARKFNVPKKSTSYDEDFLERLAAEIIDAHEYGIDNETGDDWNGECKFEWPKRDFGDEDRLLTANEQATCYIGKFMCKYERIRIIYDANNKTPT